MKSHWVRSGTLCICVCLKWSPKLTENEKDDWLIYRSYIPKWPKTAVTEIEPRDLICIQTSKWPKYFFPFVLSHFGVWTPWGHFEVQSLIYLLLIFLMWLFSNNHFFSEQKMWLFWGKMWLFKNFLKIMLIIKIITFCYVMLLLA